MAMAHAVDRGVQHHDRRATTKSESVVSGMLVQGVLTGMGREAPCEILVWRDGRSNLRPYSQFRVVDAPLDLPDGAYVVAFQDRAFPTKKERGWWVVESLF